MLNLKFIMLGSENPKRLAEFYAKVLEKKADWSDGDWYGFNAGACALSIGPHDKAAGKSPNPERIMLNFETTEVDKEFERIEALGATVIAKPYSMEEGGKNSIATFADPDGNYFQLIIPWE